MSNIQSDANDIYKADKKDDVLSNVGALVSEHPLAAAGAAIAIGAVVGLLIPGFRRRAAVAGGSSVARGIGKATKALATAETVRTVLSGINGAKHSLMNGAAKVADHIPDVDAVRDGARRALAAAGETAHKAGAAAQSASASAAAQAKKAAGKIS